YKFDDERVTKEDAKRAIEEQYGGEEEIRLKREQEEKEQKKKEKAEAHLYTFIKVARDKDLTEQIGRDIYFDLVDHDKVRSFRIQKQLPFSIFKAFKSSRRSTICPKSGNFSVVVLIWSMVGQLREISNKAQNAELKLLLEVELGPDLLPSPPPEKTKEDILLFFKLYDPEKEELRYSFIYSPSSNLHYITFDKCLASPTFLFKQVELSHPDAELRLLEVFYHKIYKVSFQRKRKALFCYLIQQQIQNFGEPFLLVIHEGETLAEVKVRIQKKLQIPDDEFSKRRDVYGAWEQYLGLEHSDTAPKRAYTANQVKYILLFTC
ncbi:hypothetical protein BHM03_00022561, partial [Ensete ventricosum]